MLAVAFAPVALKACKPLVRGLGRALKKAGEMAERIADNSKIDAQPEAAAPTATVVEEKPEPAKAAPKKSAPRKKAEPKAKPADAS